MDNISLIPKNGNDKSLPRFVSFQAPKIEFSSLAKIGLALIVLVVAIIGGLYFWKYSLAKQVESFNGELQKLTSQRNMTLESRLNNLNSILEVFKNVLDQHRYWSLVFKMLEEKTLNTVTFKHFDGDETNGFISLLGTAPSYGALAQQIKIFEDSPNVISVLASDIGISEEGKVKFSLKLNFGKDLIRKK